MYMFKTKMQFFETRFSETVYQMLETIFQNNIDRFCLYVIFLK